MDWPSDIALTVYYDEPGADRREIHSLGDVAVHVARVAFDQGALNTLLDELFTGMRHRILTEYGRDRLLIEGSDAARTLANACLEEGVRLGFALALTNSQSAHGWPAWGAAALEHRQRSGCTEQAHHGELIDELRAFKAKFRPKS